MRRIKEDGKVKDLTWWNSYFTTDGGWEHNGGRTQSRQFAEEFTARSGIARDETFSMLDVGCALGDALEHFVERFPNADLSGIDFSSTAIERSRHRLGNRVSLIQGDFEALSKHYDVIYCSNTLEHFADFADKARVLCRSTRRLCVLVPFDERFYGERLNPDPTRHHQHTFSRSSFDFLVTEGVASDVQHHIFTCPPAWGWTWRRKQLETLKNVARLALGRAPAKEPFQIFYDIRVAATRR